MQWFSLIDCMDGMRARRLKCGSPLGRIIDEAGDMAVQAAYSLLIAYLFGLQGPLEIVCIQINVTFYFMELRQLIMGSLVMNVGEIGPLEMELLLTIIFASAGYFGPEIWSTPISLGLISASPGQIFAVIFIALFILFFLDDFLPCIFKNPKRTIYLCIPIFMAVNLFVGWRNLPFFGAYRAYAYLVVHSVIANTTLDLMWNCMTSREMQVIPPGPQNQPGLAMMISNGVNNFFDLGIPNWFFATLMLLFTLRNYGMFYYRMYLASKQYCDQNGIDFFWLSDAKVAAADKSSKKKTD